MTERSPELYIDDIIEAINKIERYTKDMDFSKFSENELVLDAVIRNLEIIGEASTHIPEKIREKYSNLPWKRIIGLRNIAIHGYFKIDLSLIWAIITKNIPLTKDTILKIQKECVKNK